MQCLRMAAELAGKVDAVIAAAQRMFDFVKGAEPAAPAHAANTSPEPTAADKPQAEVVAAMAGALAEAATCEPLVTDPIAACGTALVMPEGGNLAEALPSSEAVAAAEVQVETAAEETPVEVASQEAQPVAEMAAAEVATEETPVEVVAQEAEPVAEMAPTEVATEETPAEVVALEAEPVAEMAPTEVATEETPVEVASQEAQPVAEMAAAEVATEETPVEVVAQEAEPVAEMAPPRGCDRGVPSRGCRSGSRTCG